MIRRTLSKIVNDADLGASCFNFTTLYIAGVVANISSNYFFNFNLNEYRSVEHFALGAAFGTLSYRKTGGGLRGIGAGFLAAIGFNFLWESMEPYIPHYNGESFWDTTSDIASVYGGSISSFFLEKFKSGLDKFVQPTAQR
ncbi:MAG: hypothetical protein AABX84_02685 [Nanoarchaeota archaeon]